MANDDVKIGITAEDTGAAAAFKKVSAAASGSADEIKAKYESIAGVFSKVQGAFIAFTAILAGGKAFKAAIDETVNMTKNAQALGKQFGVSATEASVLAVALDDVFVSQEQFSAAGSKIAVMLKKNEDAFKQLGVATRDQNGHFKSQLDIQMDVNAALLKFKEGTDRNVEGIKIYGKSWGDVAPTLKVTAAAMQDAALKASALGLTVGQENVDATQRYRSAMNDVQDVMKGVLKAVGDALLPALSSLGEWFAGVGPSVVNGFRAALYSLYAAFSYLKEGVTIATDYIAGKLSITGAYLDRFANFANRALHLDVAGAKAAWAEGTAEIESRTKTLAANIADDMQQAAAARDAYLDRTAVGGQAPSKKPTGTDTSDGGDLKIKNQMAALEAALAAEKLHYAESAQARGEYQEYSKQQEVEFWNSQLNTQKLSSENRLAIERKTLTLQLEIKKEAFEGELALQKERISEVKGDFDQQLALARDYQAKIQAAYPNDVKAFAAAQKQIVDIERAKNEQIQSLREQSMAVLQDMALSEVDTQQRVAQLQSQMGEITYAELLEKEREFEDARNQIRVSAMQQKMAILAEDPYMNTEKIAQLNAQIEEQELAHQQRMQEIQSRTALESKRHWLDTFGAMNSGFSQVIGNFLKGTLTFKGFMQGMFSAVLDAVTNTLAAMAAQWLTTTIMQALQGKVAGSAIISAHAAEAGAAGVASTAAIPIIGPAMAPAAGLAMYGAAMAYQAGLAAEQGFDVPAGINPVTQLHQREMVLPAKYADTIRDLSEGGGGAMNRSAGPAVTININALDSKSVMDRSADIAAAIKKHLKGTGRLVPTYSP